MSTIPEPWKLNTDGREFQVGDAMKARGLEAKYPVVLIPGVISTVCSLSEPRTLVSQMD
jgi:phospholipid:diacylglycerol acyltransferase